MARVEQQTRAQRVGVEYQQSEEEGYLPIQRDRAYASDIGSIQEGRSRKPEED